MVDNNIGYEEIVLVGDWLRIWLNEAVGRNYSVTTHERYCDIVERQLIPQVGDIELRKLSPRHIRALDVQLLAGGLSARTVGIIHTVLSAACKYAVTVELIERNPMAAAAPPKAIEHEIVPPEIATVQEILAIAEREQHRLFPFLHLLVYTGMRRGEALGLRWNNVNLNSGYVRVVESAVKSHHSGMIVKRPKTAKGNRTIDLDARTIDVLAQHQDRQSFCDYQGELVFPHRDGGTMKVTTIIRDLKTLSRRAGVPEITFHSLRHFHATVALQQRQNVVVVSRRLGHASVTTTLDTYGHVMAGWQKDVAEAFAEAMAIDR